MNKQQVDHVLRSAGRITGEKQFIIVGSQALHGKHDLAISKYAAFREKDLVFTRELARRGIISSEQLLTLLEQTKLSDELRERIRARIAADFEQRAPA